MALSHNHTVRWEPVQKEEGDFRKKCRQFLGKGRTEIFQDLKTIFSFICQVLTCFRKLQYSTVNIFDVIIFRPI